MNNRHWIFWGIAGFVFCITLYILKGILTPFIAGMVVAYFLDPLADKLEVKGLSRQGATLTITAIFFMLLALTLGLLIPVTESQISQFITRLPGYIEGIEERMQPILRQAQKLVSPEDLASLKSAAGSQASSAMKWVGGIFEGLWAGGKAIISLISLIFITPLVTFYLLRDWDVLIARIDSYLPRHHAEEIRGCVREIDQTIAAFVRGQGMICLILGVYYGLALSILGLDMGLLVGLGIGLASFIPLVGVLLGFVLSLGLALAQFTDTLPILILLGIFVLGQVLEGSFLTPLLVGGKIGLHPVWITFALLAGGSLLGFTGVLLAVPLAAVIGVLVRFFLDRYLKSHLYQGNKPE